MERRPLIRISEGIYYWPLLHAAPLFGAGWLDEMAGFEREGERTGKSLGMERRSETLFKRGWPGCQLVRDTCWKKRYGTTQRGPDLVVQVDSALLAAQVSAADIPSWIEGGTRRFSCRVKSWQRNSREILTDFHRALIDGKAAEVIGADGKQIDPEDIHRELTAERWRLSWKNRRTGSGRSHQIRIRCYLVLLWEIWKIYSLSCPALPEKSIIC